MAEIKRIREQRKEERMCIGAGDDVALSALPTYSAPLGLPSYNVPLGFVSPTWKPLSEITLGMVQDRKSVLFSRQGTVYMGIAGQEPDADGWMLPPKALATNTD